MLLLQHTYSLEKGLMAFNKKVSTQLIARLLIYESVNENYIEILSSINTS